MTKKTSLTLLFLICCAVCYGQTANFTASVTSGCSPLVVNFQDQSTGNPTSWFWDFGNGATATLQNPSTTYFTPGTYTVKLTVTNAQGTNTLTRSQFITIYGKPQVGLIVNDSTACFPHRAQFTDLSTASPGTANTSWLWDFGDGTQSTVQNPLHVFTSTGNYTVNLKVTNDKGCYSVLSKTAYIRIAGGVVTDFTHTQPSVCKPPHNITFTNNSTGPGTLTWFWDFGDGTTSTLQNPVHTYVDSGNYTVSLATVSGDGCADTVRRTGTLDFRTINTSFNVPDSVCINSNLNFANNSTPTPVSSNWVFGDGTTSTLINPVKVFSTVGTYTVRLYNTYSYCSDSVSKVIRVMPRPVADYTSNLRFNCKPPFTVNFQDRSANAVSWLWDFGDSTTSTVQNPSHTYSRYGSFDVRLIVTNSSGCTDTIGRTAYIQVTRPVISFTNLPQNGCIPYPISPVAGITTLDAVTSYSWTFGDGGTSNSATPSHTYTNQGIYPVALTITTSTGCTETYTMASAITVGRRPSVNFSAAPNPVCAFQRVQFTDMTNEATSWFWQFGDGGQSADQHPRYQYTDTGLFTVRLIATNYGCADSFSRNSYIRVKPPIARFGFETNCDNRLRFQFRDSSIGATSWLWDFGDGTTSTDPNPVHVFPSYKTYTVSLTVNNDTCSNTLKKDIKVVKEVINFTADRTNACRVASIQFISSAPDPTNIVNYYWDPGNGLAASGSAVVSTLYNNSGLYSVRLITTDIYGCLDTVTKTDYIRIKGPVADFTASNTSGCKGLTTTFNDLSRGDGVSPIVSWQWDFGDYTVRTFTSGPFQHTYDTAGMFTPKLTVTDAAGCSDNLLISNLVVATEPKAMFASADTLSCPGSSVQFNNLSTGINLSSSWNFGDGNTSTTFSPSNIYNATGNYSVSLKVTDQYACSDSLLHPVYIKINKPVASYTVNDSVSSCTPFEVQFTNTSQYYHTSHWDLGGGISTIKNPVQYYNAPGIFPVQLIVTSPGNCKDTAYGTVHVYDTVGSNVRYTPFDGCKPLTVGLTTFSPGPMTYTWDFGDGVLITNDSVQMNHVYNFFGNFVPKVIMTDPAGCVIPVSGLDTIHIKGAIVKFGVDNRLFCDSGLVRFIDSTTYNDSLMGYNWNFGDGATSTLQNPSHYYSSPGTYTPSLNVQTENACVDTFRLTNPIKVVQSPLISIGGDSVICANDSLQHFGLFNRSDTSAVQWAWQLPNGNSSVLQNPGAQQYKSAGSFIVRTVAVNSSGCKDSASKSLLVNPLPEVTMPSAITMQVGFPITIPATYTSNVHSWIWSPTNTLSCADCPQPVAGPKFNTTYTVSFIDSNGCRNASQVQVIVICKNANVFVPNTFSPNSDGSNDIFYVRGKGLERVKSLRVFNRWGEIVFERQNFPVNDATYGWNGIYKGNKPVPDVYVYQVEVFCDNSQIIRFEGNVALIQ